MDYCSTCRRHLNGALVCPGCGAYAPDIAPLADGTPAPSAVTASPAQQSPAPLWSEADSVAEDLGQVPQEHPYDGPDAPSLAPTGRAARRRQRERWKKTQRRALVATAVALVGGGMTAVSLNRQSPDRTQAASAPDREVMGAAEEQVTDPTPVSSTPTGSHRAKHASPASTARSATTGTPHEQAAAAPQARPKTQIVQQKSVTSPLTVVNSGVSEVASTVSDATDTATGTTSSSAPPATDSTSTSTSTSGTDTTTDTSPATPAPSDPSTSTSSSASSSPAGICLLGLVCIT
ncbi:SCO2400 family protein [Streptomyces sp. B21-083]|uniref:SCO2400 family protein n=1 Tax=Streptomyces sp. B21-083 TaxID=3039410 RepID=UPI002FF05BC3